MSAAPHFLKKHVVRCRLVERDYRARAAARTIAKVPLVFWRDNEGRSWRSRIGAVIEPRHCSKGRLENDRLRCMYHGLLFDTSGRCVEIPSQEFIPPAAKVRAYPVVERFKWFGLDGRPRKSRCGPQPRYALSRRCGMAGHPGVLALRGETLLITDNLLDFLALILCSRNYAGAARQSTQYPPQVTRNGRGVRVERCWSTTNLRPSCDN